MNDEIEQRIQDGWTLEVSLHPGGRVQATVYKARRLYGHHHLGATVQQAIEALDQYIRSPSATDYDKANAQNKNSQ